MRTFVFDGRYNERRLAATERPKVVFDYYVTGCRDFPFDMLRHDYAWPARGEDAAKLEWEESKRNVPRSIKLRSYRKPTIERWSSFGWSVGFAAVGVEHAVP